MSHVLVVANALDGTLARSALELLGGARAITGPDQLDAVLLAPQRLADAAATLGRHGVSRVFHVAHAALGTGQTDAALIATEAVMERAGPQVVLVAADTVGRELAPRLAFRRRAALITEAMALHQDGETLVARRQVYGGRAMATLAATKRPVVVSVKPRSFDVPEASVASGSVEDVPVTIDPGSLRAVVKNVAAETAEVGLEEAQVVIGGGRGIGGAEGFQLLQALAEQLQGAVGSSRPPADEGWVPISWQIGQTGKTIRPNLYVAVGISGAAQHIAGVSGARTIVAINRDNQAPIFSLAHFGLVGDYRQIVPALISKLKELKAI
ncbi:MAG TPA: electron transfer flavoprotein subunit alpha/FixB family protein [bacterium]